jgi:hypothetical protein
VNLKTKNKDSFPPTWLNWSQRQMHLFMSKTIN